MCFSYFQKQAQGEKEVQASHMSCQVGSSRRKERAGLTAWRRLKPSYTWGILVGDEESEKVFHSIHIKAKAALA
jgi:hypothetical protein